MQMLSKLSELVACTVKRVFAYVALKVGVSVLMWHSSAVDYRLRS